MNKQPQQKPDIKKILKPLLKEIVKECLLDEKIIKETLLEQGVLSKIISEVVFGLNNSLITENKNISLKKQEKTYIDPDPELVFQREQLKNELEDEKKKLREKKIIEATGLANIFDNIKKEQNKQIEIKNSIKIHESEKQIDEEKELILSPEEKKIVLEENKEKKKKAQEEERANIKFGVPSGGFVLSGIDPGNPGIPIDGFAELVGGNKRNWGRIAKALKE